MKVSILAYNQCSSYAVTGPMEILNMVNRIYNRNNKLPDNHNFFDVKIVSADDIEVNASYNFKIKCDYTIRDQFETDLIILSGTSYFKTEFIDQKPEIPEWLLQKYENGAHIATACTGAFFLAETGLLKGRNASTHWYTEKLFRERYPHVNLQCDKILVDEGRIYMSGGGASFQNLLIYLIEKYMGRKYSIIIAKIFLFDVSRDVQTSYAIFSHQRDHNDENILKAQEFIEKNFRKKISIDYLSDYVALSQRSFIRRFKKATGNTPSEYIQRVKVEAAKKIIESKDLTFEEIVREVGYEDISTFRKLFKKITGIVPNEYRRKYNRTKEMIIHTAGILK